MRENNQEAPPWEEQETAIVPVNEDNAVEVTALAEAERSRAVQEIQAALIMAKRFPRDSNAAYTRIMKDCSRISLANIAVYRYPRGGQSISGPSIRLAEVMARAYGNLDFGVKEVERRKGSSTVMSYCRDMETNVIARKSFEVAHEIQLKSRQIKRLTDPRDIYELAANMGSRRLRACILHVIPGDIVDSALAQCRKTLAAGDGKETLEDRVRKMILAFTGLGVSQEMLEERLEHKAELTTGDELVDLISIFNAIKDGQSKRRDFFNFPEGDSSTGKAAEFREAMAEAAPEPRRES